jgi:choline dehydrogenase
MDEYDVVIVGSGSAGSALAGRLSEDPGRRVLVLEAGPAVKDIGDYPTEVLAVSNRSAYEAGHPNNWAFPARLTARREWVVARGRILGGSSAINGGYFVRGLPGDFDAWAVRGLEAWSYPNVLPFYKRLERDLDFGDDVHGTAGPVPVKRAEGALLSPLSGAFIGACLELGFSFEEDKNRGADPGVGLVPGNTIDGMRVNTAMSYVIPNLGRPNLTVQGDRFVRRVVFAGTRAIGVELEGEDGRVETVRGEEIVLSAGAVKSPHILLLSGIGPADELTAAGIRPIEDLAGVGKDWFDDPAVLVDYHASADIGFDERMLVPQASLNWNAGDDPAGDVELLLYVSPVQPKVLSIICILQQELSRGSMEILSADPHVYPRIDYHYLSRRGDLTRLRLGVELCLEVLESGRHGGWVDRVVAPDYQEPRDKDSLEEFVQDRIATTVHAAGTAKMGAPDDGTSVVDEKLRVHGVEGLRIVDTSVIPTPLHRGPSATATMIGERAAALF